VHSQEAVNRIEEAGLGKAFARMQLISYYQKKDNAIQRQTIEDQEKTIFKLNAELQNLKRAGSRPPPLDDGRM